MDSRIQNNLAFGIPKVRNGYGIPLHVSKFYDSQNIRVQNIVSGSSHGTFPKFSYILIGSHGECTTRATGWLGHMIHVAMECTRHAAAPGSNVKIDEEQMSWKRLVLVRINIQLYCQISKFCYF